MVRKVFLSFLGTSKYKKCVYDSFEMGQSGVVQYAQTAILDLYCKDFSEGDIAYIFLTKEAEKKNWVQLKNEIDERNFLIKPITDIPEGYSEEEIWEIFEMVYRVIEKEDEIILDVTHGFRSLPMLQIVLLNYAHSLKSIEIKNILYGAFEAIGVPAYQIEEEIPNPANRKAPLLDLTTFSAIQSWTFGAQNFIKTGVPQAITTMSMDNIKPILAKSRGADDTARNLRSLMIAIDNIQMAINTNRGKKIMESNEIQRAREAIENLNGDQTVFAPIGPLLKQIQNKLSYFDEMPHWEAAVKWCVDHGMVQQGITQLQEGIISSICEDFQLDSKELEDREIVSQALNIYDRDIPEEEWNKPAADHQDLVRRIIDDEFVIQHKANYSNLSGLRNDINHAGYRKGALNDGKKFKIRLKVIFEEFRKIKNQTTSLLNLSNHPSKDWPDKQKTTAIQEYGEIRDLPFPKINPNWSAEELNREIQKYENNVTKINPAAVHIMGEMTFTYGLVERLKKIGIPCIASTTERSVTEDKNGKKTSHFKFVRFRSY